MIKLYGIVMVRYGTVQYGTNIVTVDNNRVFSGIAPLKSPGFVSEGYCHWLNRTVLLPYGKVLYSF